jgi:hypothetical protein
MRLRNSVKSDDVAPTMAEGRNTYTTVKSQIVAVACYIMTA